MLVAAERVKTAVSDELLSMMSLPCRHRFGGSGAEVMPASGSPAPARAARGAVGEGLSILLVIGPGDGQRRGEQQ